MKMQKYMLVTIIAMVLTLPLSTWAFFGPWGKLRLQPRGVERVTYEMLLENWQDYDVYFAGPWKGRPSAIMFDPRGDDRKLEHHKWWEPIKDEETLAEVAWGIYVGQVSFFPEVWRILGPDNQFYGYMYTAWHHVLIKVVDDRTLWVDDIPLPRLLPGGLDRGGVD